MNEENREVVGWFTTHGKHIPIMKGETKDQAIKRAFGNAPKLKSDATTKSSNAKTNKSTKNASKHDEINKKVDKKSTKLNKSNQDELEKKKNTISRDDVKKLKDKKSTQISKAKSDAEKLNAEQQYQNSLRMGNKVETKDGHLVFKGKDVKPLDTSDVQEGDSLSKHIDKDGNLTPERLKVHQQLIEEYFGEHKPYAPSEEKKCLFTGGGGASGKGQFSNRVGDFYSSDDKPIVVDADEIKKMLAKADGVKLDMDTTPFYHEESSALAKQIFALSLENNYPVMFDGTAVGVKSALKKIEQAKAAGYKTEMNFLFSDFNTVLNNSIRRYDEKDRLVPLIDQLSAHAQAYDAVEQLNDKFDSFTLWDNRRDSKGNYKMQKVCTNTNGGKMKFEKGGQQSYDDFAKSVEEFEYTGDKASQFWGAVASVNTQKGRSNEPTVELISKEYNRELKKRKKQQSGSGGK